MGLIFLDFCFLLIFKRRNGGKIERLTFLPTWLLCMLIFECRSRLSSLESINCFENLVPNRRLWEHPSHLNLDGRIHLVPPTRSFFRPFVL